MKIWSQLNRKYQREPSVATDVKEIGVAVEECNLWKR